MVEPKQEVHGSQDSPVVQRGVNGRPARVGMYVEELEKFRLDTLKEYCRQFGERVSGSKHVLALRLVSSSHFMEFWLSQIEAPRHVDSASARTFRGIGGTGHGGVSPSTPMGVSPALRTTAALLPPGMTLHPNAVAAEDAAPVPCEAEMKRRAQVRREHETALEWVRGLRTTPDSELAMASYLRRYLHVTDPENVSGCLKAALYNNQLILNEACPEMTILYDHPCPRCGTKLVVRVEDVLYQLDYGDAPRAEPTVRCSNRRCDYSAFLTRFCVGRPTVDPGPGHHHCVLCTPPYGSCVGACYLVHCPFCSVHGVCNSRCEGCGSRLPATVEESYNTVLRLAEESSSPPRFKREPDLFDSFQPTPQKRVHLL